MSVAVKRSELHGRGLFAEKAFKRGERIGVFEGRLAWKNSSHVLWLGEVGLLVTNEMRFINHSPTPNSYVDGYGVCTALRAIEPGEEITFNYGDDYFDADEWGGAIT